MVGYANNALLWPLPRTNTRSSRARTPTPKGAGKQANLCQIFNCSIRQGGVWCPAPSRTSSTDPHRRNPAVTERPVARVPPDRKGGRSSMQALVANRVSRGTLAAHSTPGKAERDWAGAFSRASRRRLLCSNAGRADRHGGAAAPDSIDAYPVPAPSPLHRHTPEDDDEVLRLGGSAATPKGGRRYFFWVCQKLPAASAEPTAPAAWSGSEREERAAWGRSIVEQRQPPPPRPPRNLDISGNSEPLRGPQPPSMRQNQPPNRMRWPPTLGLVRGTRPGGAAAGAWDPQLAPDGSPAPKSRARRLRQRGVRHSVAHVGGGGNDHDIWAADRQ